MSIRDWPEDERPRERLLARGAAALTDAELLAIFLRTGVVGKSALDLARELLTRFDGLRGLMRAGLADCEAVKGLGAAKYAQLQAVLELARRHLAAELVGRTVLDSPDRVRALLLAELRDRSQERVLGLFLDAQHGLIRVETLAVGTLDQATLYPREVAASALRLGATGLILAHNHPSGAPEPSAADIALTRRLSAALAALEVCLLDHLVVGEGGIVSLAERGLMGPPIDPLGG